MRAKNEVHTVLGPIHPMSQHPAFHISTLFFLFAVLHTQKSPLISIDFPTCEKCGKVAHAFNSMFAAVFFLCRNMSLLVAFGM